MNYLHGPGKDVCYLADIVWHVPVKGGRGASRIGGTRHEYRKWRELLCQGLGQQVYAVSELFVLSDHQASARDTVLDLMQLGEHVLKSSSIGNNAYLEQSHSMCEVPAMFRYRGSMPILVQHPTPYWFLSKALQGRAYLQELATHDTQRWVARALSKQHALMEVHDIFPKHIVDCFRRQVLCSL